jgi:sporulation protein YlmC with PRC-barrel domain
VESSSAELLFPSTLQQERTMNQTRPFSNPPVKAASIIGRKVLNVDNESLGDVKEIMIDPGTGRVAYVVVSFGGFLSIGEKLFAVPFGALKYNVTIDSYFLDVSKDRLSVAPGFDPDHWPSMADEKWNSDVHTFYECTPYWH